MKITATATGKIILSGDYAVVFDEPGIAIPAPFTIQATIEEQHPKNYSLPTTHYPLEIQWLGISGGEPWTEYLKKIIALLEVNREPFRGTLTITNEIPLQKGLGSSTALVIAVTRCLLGPGKQAEALAVEDAVNAGHSGLDFSVIWEGKPVLFQRNQPVQYIDFNFPFTQAVLIDTGKPNEATPELVAWVRERLSDPRVGSAIKNIGKCTQRLQKGEDPRTVFRDHHRAQSALGIVPKDAAKLIAEIERIGGAAKVIGAGGKTGGGGMVLAMHKNTDMIRPIARRAGFPILPLIHMS
ncbi:MAG: hypothetical protein WCG83_03430 [Candidatus Peregrinibacteria bacterium]